MSEHVISASCLHMIYFRWYSTTVLALLCRDIETEIDSYDALFTVIRRSLGPIQGTPGDLQTIVIVFLHSFNWLKSKQRNSERHAFQSILPILDNVGSEYGVLGTTSLSIQSCPLLRRDIRPKRSEPDRRRKWELIDWWRSGKIKGYFLKMGWSFLLLICSFTLVSCILLPYLIKMVKAHRTSCYEHDLVGW